MERSRGLQSGMKKVVAAMFLATALASTGCGQNALLNPTAGEVAGSGDANQATSLGAESQQGGQLGKP
jgi:hypothetical protein